MKAFSSFLKATPPAMLALSAGLAMTALCAGAQMSMPAATSAQAQQKTDTAPTQDTQAQINALQQQVLKLQAALKQSHTGKATTAKGSTAEAKPAMSMGDDASEREGMAPHASKPPMAPIGDEMEKMDAMSPAAGRMKAKTMKPMGCCGMSMGKPMARSGMADDKMGSISGGGVAPMKGKGMAGQPMTGAATPESPHLLHVGAKDFFLDHQQHINMTIDQKMQLEKLKSDASQQKMAAEANIDQSEQDLWQLTSADQPNAGAINSKVQEVAKLRAEEQMSFIHSVSMASDVLTPEQRAQVVTPMSPAKGMKSPMAKKPMTVSTKME